MKPRGVLAALPLAGCGMVNVVSKVSWPEGVQVVGTGLPHTESRKAKTATAVEFSGGLQVTLRHSTPKLTIKTQKEILRCVRSEFKGDRLRVWLEGNIHGSAPSVVFTTPSLTEIRAGGATTIDAGTLTGGGIKIRLSGASKITARGRLDSLDIKLSGASSAAFKDVEAQTVQIEATGASMAWVTVRKGLSAIADGASKIRYGGKPALRRKSANGASSVKPS